MQGQTGLTPFLCSLRSRFNSWPHHARGCPNRRGLRRLVAAGVNPLLTCHTGIQGAAQTVLVGSIYEHCTYISLRTLLPVQNVPGGTFQPART
jgi:hypothetical protein